MKRKRTQSSNQTWCNVCKMWIADNRAQRDQHEMGSKHKAAQAKLIKDIARKNESARVSKTESPEISSPKNSPVRKQCAAEQLLEHAVSGNSQIHNMFYYASDITEQPAEALTNVFVPVEEPRVHDTFEAEADDLDRSRFPLPPDATMGVWMPVNDVNNEELENNLNSKNETVEENGTAVSGPDGKSATALATFKTRKSASTKRRRRADG